MEYLLIALLVAIVIGYIAYPLFFAPRAEIADTTGALDTLAAQRDATYDAIRDLDFDFQLGKLSQTDHTALRDKYVARAAQVLHEIDAQRASVGAPAAGEIATRVAPSRDKKTDAIEAEVARLRAARKSALLTCTRCSTPYKPGDRFCARCGNTLTPDS